MPDIDKILIGDDSSVKEALSRLDENGLGVLFLVDKVGVFRRTVTDGDLRRMLLGDCGMDAHLAQLPKIESIVVRESDPPAKAYTLMKKHAIRHVPVLDGRGRVTGIRRREDVDHPILLSVPHLSDLEQQYVAEAFESNWVAPLGPNVDGFEQEMAQYLGVRQGAALSSGTAALHLALVVLEIGAGDIVFCPSLTFVASANPILYQGAVPVLIDSAPNSWNMCPKALEMAFERAARAKKLPKAVIAVNLYGHSADYDAIRAVCGRYQVPIVEDAAESLGAIYKGRASGSLGDLATLSFNGNKIITTSGGGMLVSDNGDYIDKARWLSTQAKDDANYYLHSALGFNYRMSNVLAGIGRGQLAVLPDRVDARRAIYRRYRQELEDEGQFEWIEELPESTATHWLSVVLLRKDAKVTPDGLIKKLAAQGIEARRVWNPMHRQPLYDSAEFISLSSASVSDDLFARGVCLPSSSSITSEQQSRIVAAIKQVLSVAS